MSRFDRSFPSGLYRSRNGAIFGVCRGLAEYFNFSLFWTRTIAVIFFLMSGFWPIVVLYLIAALLLKPEPVIPIQSEEEQEFYDTYTTSRHRAAQRLKRRYENLERRIQRMEHIVTATEFNWEDRL